MILQMTVPVQGGLRQERRFEIIANHLANVDTTGFKQDVLTFDQMFKANLTTDFTQGDLKMTENDLDLALADDGFFKVQTPRGLRYTRNGNFMRNTQGVLVTQEGDPILGQAGEITIDGSDINITETGEVYVDGVLVDQLDIVTFENLNGLQKEGSSLFAYQGDPAADEVAPQRLLVKQGALERPNINNVKEMTSMIDTQRMYESYQKIIQSFDETDAKAITEVGRPL